MEISPALGIVILVNNYLHDIATALLVTSAAAMWAITKKYEGHPQKGDRALAEYFLGLFRSMTRLAKLSLLLLVVGGVPRTIFYRDFEWVTAVEHGQVPALIVEHVIAFAFVAAGVRLWIKLRRKVRSVEETLALEKA